MTRQPHSDDTDQRQDDQLHTAQLAARYAHLLTTDILFEDVVRQESTSQTTHEEA